MLQSLAAGRQRCIGIPVKCSPAHRVEEGRHLLSAKKTNLVG